MLSILLLLGLLRTSGALTNDSLSSVLATAPNGTTTTPPPSDLNASSFRAQDKEVSAASPALINHVVFTIPPSARPGDTLAFQVEGVEGRFEVSDECSRFSSLPLLPRSLLYLMRTRNYLKYKTVFRPRRGAAGPVASSSSDSRGREPPC